MAAITITTTPTSAPAIAPTGDSLTGDLSELGVGSGTVAPEEICGKEWDKGED